LRGKNREKLEKRLKRTDPMAAFADT